VRALLRRTVSKAWHDRILGLSAEAAFWQLLSLPPLILASIASLGYVANWFGPDTVSRVQTQIEAALSRGFSSEFVNETIGPTLNEVLHGQRIGLISIGFILALWAGSSGPPPTSTPSRLPTTCAISAVPCAADCWPSACFSAWS
jgi:membrane protein